MSRRILMITFKLDDILMLGTATSSTQIEGGDTNNTWYKWCQSGHISDSSSCITACDHWNRIEQDTEILKSLNVQTHRMSLKWSRIEPSEGKFSDESINHYRNEIQLLLNNNIKPLVTLHQSYIPLFENIDLHEGLILNYKDTDGQIFLVHGHQVDYFNDNLWGLSRFLVKYFWKPLESLGIKDPTSTSTNYEKKAKIEKKLIEWTKRENHMLIAGHTHRSVFPEVNEPPYFNDGCCVYPSWITAIEITNGKIILVKWGVKTKNDGTLFVSREILEGPNKLINYFKNVIKQDKDIAKL
jgi:predicted phosphodiesterase